MIEDESTGLSMPRSNLPLIVKPDELERHLERHDLLVVDLGDQANHAMYHVAGAVHLEYQRIVLARAPIPNLTAFL